MARASPTDFGFYGLGSADVFGELARKHGAGCISQLGKLACTPALLAPARARFWLSWAKLSGARLSRHPAAATMRHRFRSHCFSCS